MKKILLFATLLCIGIFDANGALRDQNAINRATDSTQSNTSTSENRAATTNVRARDTRGTTTTTSRTNNVTTRGNDTVARTSASRKATPTRTATARNTSNTIHANSNTARTNTSRAATNVRSATTSNTARNTTTGTTSARAAASRAATRAAKTSVVTQTFGGEYNTCRDAYFTCMDQFCANQNADYRRCVCSSRLTDVQNRERALSQTATQLQDFKDLNIEVINKSAGEVTAMLSATTGEAAAANAKDTSAASKQLQGISSVLSGSKQNAISNAGSMDIAGDINAIWETTDFMGATNIVNLTGESLYNAVHAQCAELVGDSCASDTTLTMVTSAYGMYIENDCSNLLNALDKKLTSANKSIRDTEREMTTARLENYNAHNATAINDCIAQVRKDLTADTACGADYVHCLDLTGKYLNFNTGEPIYSADFYQLNNQLTLTGDVLTAPMNQAMVERLTSMRAHAERGLDTCRDISDSVWTEFMRQAIVEIYQGQQSRVRQVKDECLGVVTQCYDEQAQQLKDFSNIKEQLLLGQRLELSEEMCRVKMDTCSNLYGDGAGNGMELLLSTLHSITDQKIGKACRVTLVEYVNEICAVPSTDTNHKYPYGCRAYAPGESTYAQYPMCNKTITQGSIVPLLKQYTNKNPDAERGFQSCINSDAGLCPTSAACDTSDTSGPISCILTPSSTIPDMYLQQCRLKIKYFACREGYYLADQNGTPISTKKQLYNLKKGESEGVYILDENVAGNQCAPCPRNHTCAGGAEPPVAASGSALKTYLYTSTSVCGDDYIGSLYQKLVQYASESCVRPSDAEKNDFVPPVDILEDVSSVMNEVRAALVAELAAECERLGGEWVSQQPTSADISQFLDKFYNETGANKKWGYCRPQTSQTDTNTEQ